MSMLAEPRKKQKWSVDPRNSAWSKDDNKFGQKMLERMGWSKGKGLGRSEQGATEHIKVKVKNNSYGLGTSASHEDNWIAHQDDFNELLTHLNNCHGQNDNNECTESLSEEQKGFSLEEKSKTAKKRVHYMKFTKGKDLSSRSEKDLNCIFGKRVQSSKEQEQENNNSDSQAENEEMAAIPPTELDTESITKTVTSTLTMQEYFAQQMARLKKARVEARSPETSEMSGQSGESSPIHCNNTGADQPITKKKKKKDKKAKTEMFEEKHESVFVEREDQVQVQSEKRKKKKRLINENDTPLTPEEMPSSKKNKKHKKETERLNGQLLAEDENVQLEITEEVECVVEKDTGVKKKSKKDKKKKKKQVETLE